MASNVDLSLFTLAREVCVEDMIRILRSRITRSPAPLPGLEGLSIAFDRLTMGVDCDEVYPNLLIGDESSALSRLYLQHLGITHVLNAAEGNTPGMVNTSALYYADCHIIYKGMPITDDPSYNISWLFSDAADFIERCIRSGGKILIHCKKGKSRSPVLVLGYMVIKLNIPLPTAMTIILQKRAIQPNVGFLQQIVQLHNNKLLAFQFATHHQQM